MLSRNLPRQSGPLCGLLGLILSLSATGKVGPDVAWPDAITVCLNHGAFLNERLLVSMGDEEIEMGPEAVQALFRERALPHMDNPEVLEQADEIDANLFILAEEHMHFSDITREMRLPVSEERAVTIKLRGRADTFGDKRENWDVSVTATGELRVTLMNRNNTVEERGSTPAELPPEFVFSDQGEIRFSHPDGASIAIPTALFLKTLQRARKLCES